MSPNFQGLSQNPVKSGKSMSPNFQGLIQNPVKHNMGKYRC